MDLSQGTAEPSDVARFLAAWFAVRQAIQAANFNHFQKAGLSATQFMTLNLLPVVGGNFTIGELARRMNLKAATVAKTVDSLEARGMVERSRSATDRRLVLVSITNQGRTLQNAAMGQFRAYIGSIFTSMPAKSRAALIQGLECLVRIANSPTNRLDATPTTGDRAAARARRSSLRSPQQ